MNEHRKSGPAVIGPVRLAASGWTGRHVVRKVQVAVPTVALPRLTSSERVDLMHFILYGDRGCSSTQRGKWLAAAAPRHEWRVAA